MTDVKIIIRKLNCSVLNNTVTRTIFQYRVLSYLSFEDVLTGLSRRLCKSDTLIQFNLYCSYEANWGSLSWRPDEFDVDPKELGRINLLLLMPYDFACFGYRSIAEGRYLRDHWKIWGMVIDRYKDIENISINNKHLVEVLHSFGVLNTMCHLDKSCREFMMEAYEWIERHGLTNGLDYYIDYNKYDFINKPGEEEEEEQD